MGYHKDTSGEALSMSAFEWNPIGVGMEHTDYQVLQVHSLAPFPHFFLSCRSITDALAAIFHGEFDNAQPLFSLPFLLVVLADSWISYRIV